MSKLYTSRSNWKRRNLFKAQKYTRAFEPDSGKRENVCFTRAAAKTDRDTFALDIVLFYIRHLFVFTRTDNYRVKKKEKYISPKKQRNSSTFSLPC